jgi:hypothetical protein
VDPETLRQMQFGGGVSGSIFSPVALAIILLAGAAVLFLPRQKAIIPFFAAAILIPLDQILLIGGLHFPMLRVLLLFGFARLIRAKLSGDEIFSGGINGIDKAMLVLMLFSAVDGILLWRQMGEVIFQLGNLYTTIGSYFLLRYLIRDEEDVQRTLHVWACVAVAVALIMACEQLTGKNPLYMAIGGARAAIAETVGARDGSLRAGGSFSHPILAGTFGGFSLPLFVGLWWRNKGDRKYAAFGAVSCVVMAVAANSSTALLGGLGGVLGLCFWVLRKKMRLVRWGVILTLAALQMVMKSPVWHIISDIDFTGSSSSYHRYMLLDQCIRHFFDWFLVGSKDFGTWGWDMWDLSNQYVATADTVGLIPLIALLTIIVLGFKYLGRARRAVEGEKGEERFIWAMGACLFANLVAFFGISYFDQTIVAWYAILAMIGTTTASVRIAQPEPQVSVAVLKSEQSFRTQLEPRPLRGQAPSKA